MSDTLPEELAADAPPSPLRREWLRRAASLTAWATLPTGLVGCGGGGSDTSPAPQPGGQPSGSDIAARHAALTATQADFDRLRAGAAQANPVQLADTLRASGRFSRVDVMPDGGVAARFADGHWLLVGSPPAPAATRPAARSAAPMAPSATAGATASGPAATAAGPAAVRPTGVPVSRAARSFCCFALYPREDGEIGRFDPFETPLRDAGWDIPGSQFAEVETLKSLPELGFLNWATHGGTLNADGTMTHALLTETMVEEHTLAAHQADLTAGRLIYYIAAIAWLRGSWESLTMFAITPTFISHYGWRFSSDSVVVINACASDNPALRDAFAAAGAALYGGWNKPVWVHRAGAVNDRLLDDFLATNRATAEGVPLNRPHDHVAILARTDAEGLTRYEDPTEGGVTRFNFTVLRGQPGGVMPTIQRLLVSEGESQLVLQGAFGSVPGAVWIGTELVAPDTHEGLPWQPEAPTELTLLRWSPEEVVVALPRSGPGSAGHVAVRVGSRWSNARPLTRWSGTLQLHQRGPGSLALQHTLAFSLRADIQPWRDGPHGPLRTARMPVLGTPADAPSHWDWRASGSHAHSSSPGSTQTVSWSGAGRTPLTLLAGGAGNEFYSLVGFWNPAAPTPRFELAMVGARSSAVVATELIQEGGGSWTNTQTLSLELPDRLAEDGGQLGLRWAPDEEYALPASSAAFDHALALPMAGPDAPPLASTLQQPRTAAEHAPDTDGLGGL
ncbi:MAG TPA: hypothetical protein VGF12_16890 [Roseateles sp.]|uniref:hypothetical protein n=1 Tax=Roseateles sp. TaxID=1971397 RepID=UPI002EDAAC39